MRKLDFA